MQHDQDTVAGLADRITTKQRNAVQREVSRLLDDLAPERPPPRRDGPVPQIKLHRSPGRCIMQGNAHAVSVSWLPGRADEDSFGTMLVIAWKGTVSVPGSTQRPAGDAVAVQTVQLEPVENPAGEWAWHAAGESAPLPTGALASYCRDLLQS